jgi:predicted transposase/invertase (TIGR01784 family)
MQKQPKYKSAKKAIKRKSTTKTPLGKYVNPATDFGFKLIFGLEAFLLHFLNALLPIEGGIASLEYRNTVRSRRSKEERENIFDLYCTSGKGEHFIIEMQNHGQKYFSDRALYYAACSIKEQAVRGKKWNYRLHPVYSINISNFRMYNSHKEKYVSFVKLTDIETHEVFNNNLIFVFIELPVFAKKEADLKTCLEQWIYAIKNLPKLKNQPQALKEGIFKDLFELAEIANFSQEKRKEYEQSLKRFRNMSLVITELKEENAALAQEIAALRQQLGISVAPPASMGGGRTSTVRARSKR